MRHVSRRYVRASLKRRAYKLFIQKHFCVRIPVDKSGSRRPRGSKLCRDTCYINTNPNQSVLGHFGNFEKIVHFCSFRSFWESGASFRSTKRQFLFTLYLPNIVNQQKSLEHILRAPNHCPIGSKSPRHITACKKRWTS